MTAQHGRQLVPGVHTVTHNYGITQNRPVKIKEASGTIPAHSWPD
jgi:hypothetical protein